MKKFLIVPLLLCAFCGLRPASAQEPATFSSAANAGDKYAAPLRAFETDIQRYMEKNQIPGLTIGFIKDDYVWVKGFGYADVENKIPATVDSSYRLASVQKPMTAAAVLQLVELGKINLDAPIQTYVPYFPKKEYPVTVRQVLGHLGGIRHYVGLAETTITTHKTTRQSLAIFEDSPLLARPGTQYHYSSYGYNLLGAAIEGASKQPYADYMRDHIWRPLGMNDIQMDDPLVLSPNRVKGYRLVAGQRKPSVFVDVSSRFASGGARATVGDLLKFMRGLDDGKLLTPESRALMFTPMKIPSAASSSGQAKSTGYGMGWEVARRKSGTVLFHTGSQQETRTFILHVPAKHFAIAFAMNWEDNQSLTALVYQLYELILGEKWSTAATP